MSCIVYHTSFVGSIFYCEKNLMVQEFPFLDTDYPDEIEKENAFHWAGTDCQDS